MEIMQSKKLPVAKTPKAPAPQSAAQRHRKSAAPVTAASNPGTQASTEDIARLAYSLWEERGRPEGSSEIDWLRAEQELLGKR